MEDRPQLRFKRLAHRSLVRILLAIIVGVVGWACWLSRPYFKAAIYAYRIRHDKKTGAGEANVIALGRLHHVAGEVELDKFACAIDPPDRYDSTLATWALRAYYPNSRVAHGADEYDAIMGRTRAAEKRDEPWRIDKESLRNWIKTYYPHPSTDDAHLVLARETERSDPIEALRLLHAGYHSPDRDARRRIANRFQMTLERRSTADQLESWLQSDCPSHVAPNVAYVAGIKRMREGRFGDATSLFKRFLATLESDDPELRGDPIPSWQYYNGGGWGTSGASSGERWDLARYQLDECRWFCEQQLQLDAAHDPETRAATLHAMARRCFHSRDLFVNCFYYDTVFTDSDDLVGDGPIGLRDISLDNQYRQAAEILLRIARDYPDYSKREAVDYSIPLCLWRVRMRHQSDVSARLDEAIYCNFQIFAEQHPSSTMADEALFLAGIHHWMSSDHILRSPDATGRDTTVLQSNMRRIVYDYPDGDVIARYGADNPWLQMAILSRHYELDPFAARSDVASAVAQINQWVRLVRSRPSRATRVATQPEFEGDVRTRE